MFNLLPIETAEADSEGETDGRDHQRNIWSEPLIPSVCSFSLPSFHPSVLPSFIFQGGATITGIQDQTGARIDVDSNVNPCTITISGTDEAIQAAGEIITSIVNPPTTVLTCDPSRVGDLIGPGGATINGIRDHTAANIEIDRDQNPCVITITGKHYFLKATKATS